MFSPEKVDFSTISRALRSHLNHAEFQLAAGLLGGLHIAQTIEHLEALDATEAALAYRLLDKQAAVLVFQELDAPVQADLVRALQSQTVIDAFAQLPAAGRVALLDELPAMVATKLLAGLPTATRQETGILLGYPESSAGRAMSPDFISTHPQLSVAETLERISARLGNCENAQHILVIDDERRLLGTIKLSELLTEPAGTTIGELCTQSPVVQACEPETSAARVVVDRKAGMLPVLDREDRLLGVLTLPMAIAILEDAEERRSAYGSGTDPLFRPYLGTPLRHLVKARVIWLLVLAIGATLTVKVLSSFEQTLESMVVLSLFIPLIVGIGGNTGNQAATTVTRALAMGDVRGSDFWRVLMREVRIGAVLGLCLGAIALVVAGSIFELRIGLVIGISLVALCSIAAAVGGVMPIIGKFFKVDPAVFSNPFISTFVDAAGLIVYLSVAVLILG